MIFSALASFLGGSAFRMIWGEVSSWLTAKQQHDQELDRMRAQEVIDAAAHARNLEAMKLQCDLGVKVVSAQIEGDISKTDVNAWANSVDSIGKPTGIIFIDIWNGSIRPLLATIAIAAVMFEIVRNGFTLTDWDRELFAAILGLYVADRTLLHRGK
jgi:hypothetical protein